MLSCLPRGYVNGEGSSHRWHHSLNRLADPLHPLHKTGFKLLRIDQGKYPPKRIVGSNPIGQVEQIRKKGFFCFPKFFDLYPSFCSTKDPTDRQNDDLSSSMQPGSLHARVFHLRKKAFQISQVVLFHHLVSSFFDLFYHLLILSSLLMG